MNDLIKFNFGKISKEIDLIIGVPRSGILPASLLALYCHKPFISLNEFVCGLSPIGGERIRSEDFSSKKKVNVLVVDDSIYSGKALRICKDKLVNIEGDYFYTFCSIYSNEESKEKVDMYFEIVDNPRVFEWNLIRSSIYASSCVDIDGVLCEDPTEEQNDDGENYRKFILNAVPKFIPKVKIKYLVSSRLEKYRDDTLTWLKKNNIEFDELYMLNLPSKEKRIELKCHGKFKAEVYYRKRYSSVLFIESSRWQSKEINKITKQPVFCTDTMEYFDYYRKKDVRKYKIMGILSFLKRKVFK